MSFIEIYDLKKVYPNKHEALKGVSFSIEEGEIFGLLGVNGSGKSTFSSILATLHPATSGDILYRGRSIFSDINAFRRVVGYCPQRPNLHPLLTVEENLINDALYFGFSHQEAQYRMEQQLDMFDLQQYRRFKPDQLSGGYRQRATIARALMHDPELIILDEPTVGLDPSIRKRLWSIISNLGKTVILTTHYLEEAEVLSDRVCILSKGSVLLIDTPENLKKENETFEDIFIQLTEEESQ